jgi:hypothetical protein
MKPTRRTIGSAFFAALALGAPSRLWGRRDSDDDESVPNVFISPCGQPFRAASGAAYPVADWFKQADKNADGRMDQPEFMADAGDFFNILDLHKRGVLGPYEIAVYERRIAPEVLGGAGPVGALGPGRFAHLWLAQVDRPGEIAPSGSEPNTPAPRKGLDETGVGASPFSFFDEPEPVTAADLDLVGYVSKANFLKLADMHFTSLDRDSRGYLTLDKLPKTAVQRELEHTPSKRRKS